MMYGYGLGSGAAMGAFGILASLLWIVVLVDLILVGVWLWKQIAKNQ